MGTQGISPLMRRSIQLDAIAYVIIASLLVLTALLASMLLTSVAPPSDWLLGRESIQLGGAALLCVVVLYLLDQHRRLRNELLASHDQLELSQLETERACTGLTVAHRAAEILVPLDDSNALSRLVSTVRCGFGVSAAAIVNDDVLLDCAPEIDRERAFDSVSQIASAAVVGQTPITGQFGDDGSFTCAVPLRMFGTLQGVLCLWEPNEHLSAEQLEGLQLVARVVELGSEVRALFTEVNAHLEGTMRILSRLVEHRMPGHAETTARVTELCRAVGEELDLPADQMSSMLVAIELRDVGMLAELDTSDDPTLDALLDAMSKGPGSAHPALSAEYARLGGFSELVQRTIRCHHESLDGSGIPGEAAGDSIPLEARIIRVCESFVHLTTAREGIALSSREAFRIVRSGAETTFDPSVVTAFARVLLRGGNVHTGSDAIVATV